MCISRVDLNGPLVFSNGLIIVDRPQIVMGISREKIANTNMEIAMVSKCPVLSSFVISLPSSTFFLPVSNLTPHYLR